MRVEKDKLYINERYLLHLIMDYNKKSKVFFYSNQKIATILDISKQSVSNLISKLIRLGYLQKNKMTHGKRILVYTKKPFKELAIFPSQKYGDLMSEKRELINRNKELEKVQSELEYYKKENAILTKQLEELWKKIPKE